MALAHRCFDAPMNRLRFRSCSTGRSAGHAPAYPPLRPNNPAMRALHLTAATRCSAASSIARLRRRQEAIATQLDFKVAGVTFDGRQEFVSEMEEGDTVVLTRQPWNPHDSHAVLVRTIDGFDLGYVPRTINSWFQDHELIFGEVLFVGQDPASGNWGMRVAAQPTLMPAYTSPFYWGNLIGQDQTPLPVEAIQQMPALKRRGKIGKLRRREKLGFREGSGRFALPVEAVEGMLALKKELGDARWNELVKEAVTVSQGLCAVTGASEEVAPLLMVPEWQFDDSQRRVLLRRLNLVTYDVALVHFALDLGEVGQRQALDILSALNHWGPRQTLGWEEDVAVQHMEAMHELREEVREYRLDLTTRA